MHRLKVEHREDAVGLQRVLPRGHVDAPVTGLRLVAGGEQDVRVVAVVVHQLVVALRRQEAEADLDVGAVENVVHVDLQAGKVAVLLDAVLAELLLVQQDLALGAEVVDLFQQVAQIAAALGIHRVAVLLPLVQLHIGLFGHRLDLVADRGVGVLLIQSAYPSDSDIYLVAGSRSKRPSMQHEPINSFSWGIVPCTRTSFIFSTNQFTLLVSACLPRRDRLPRHGGGGGACARGGAVAGGGEPCHCPKLQTMAKLSPTPLRREPPRRGGQGDRGENHYGKQHGTPHQHHRPPEPGHGFDLLRTGVCLAEKPRQPDRPV